MKHFLTSMTADDIFDLPLCKPRFLILQICQFKFQQKCLIWTDEMIFSKLIPAVAKDLINHHSLKLDQLLPLTHNLFWGKRMLSFNFNFSKLLHQIANTFSLISFDVEFKMKRVEINLLVNDMMTFVKGYSPTFLAHLIAFYKIIVTNVSFQSSLVWYKQKKQLLGTDFISLFLASCNYIDPGRRSSIQRLQSTPDLFPQRCFLQIELIFA